MEFPRMKKLGEWSIYDQLQKIQAEIDEATEEFSKVPRTPEILERFAMEIADVRASAEGVSRMLEERFNIKDADVVAAVIEKNRRRGYYE